MATPTSTFTALDSIDGGAGTDTLKISAVTDFAAPAGATVTNVENVTIAAAAKVGAFTANDAGALDLSTLFAGVTSLTVTSGSEADFKAGTSTAVNLSGVTGGVEVVGGASQTVSLAAQGGAVQLSGTTGAVSVTSSKHGANTIDVDGGSTVTVNTTSTVDNGAITIGTTTAATGAVAITANLNGDGTATLDQADIAVTGGSTVTVASTLTINAKDESADAANTLGDVKVTGDGKTTSVTVNQTYAETEFTKAAVAVVKETSVVTFAELKQGETLIINGLTFTAAKDLTAEQAAAAFASLTAADTQVAGGPTANGLFTGTFNSAVWTSAAVSGKTVTFTAQDHDETDLTFTGTAATMPTQVKAAGTAAAAADTSVNTITYGAARVDDVAAAAIATVTLNGYSTADLGNTGTDLNALTTLSLTNGGAVELATSATTLGLTLNKVSGAIDLDNTGATVTALNVTTATADSSSAMVAAAVKDLTVAGTNALNLTGATMGALETVVVSGSAGLNLGAVTAAKSINTSATTGTVTATIDAGVATYTGGEGVDNVTTVTTTAPSKAISLGGGNDKVTLATGTTSIAAGGSIDGGTGTNTLSMVAANAAAASASTAFATKVTNFQKLVLTGATGAQEVEADVLGNYNDIEVSGAIAGHTLTLDGVTSGATLRLNDNSNIQTIALVTDAGLVANSADALNIVIGASGENGGVDSNGIVKADDVENINISVTDISTVQTPTDTKADAQGLTLNATKATTITITGDTALTLDTALNQKVTAINAANFTGALTVTAAGGVASTITGGSGKDVLTASTGSLAGGVDNATGSAAVITNDATPGVTAVAGTNAVYTIDLTGLVLNDAGDMLKFNTGGGATTVFTAVGAETATTAATAMVLAGTVTLDAVVYDVTAGGNATTVVLTAQTKAAEADNMLITAVDDAAEGGITNVTTASQAITTAGVATVVAVKEVATVVLTDGTNSGLTLGDTMALTVAGTTYTYTATAATETMDAAGTALAALINAGGLVTSATYTAGSDTLTITALTGTATNIAIAGYAVTDAAGGSAKGDTLIGGTGDDTLTAGSLATLTGGAGNDTFKMVTGLANINSYSTITDFLSGDKLDTTGTDFISAGVNLQGTAVFSDFVNAAIAQSDTGDVIWFQKDGNTYVVQNQSNHATTFDVTQDFIIALTGQVDLSTASFNTSNGFLEMA